MTGWSVVEAVGVRFGPTVALDDVGTTARPGETHALVGRSGAGKSTLVSVLRGLRAPDVGTVLFDREPAPRPSDRDGWRCRVACVYQRSTVIPELTVAESLSLNRHQRGPAGLISWRRPRREAAAVLAEWAVDVDPRLPARELGMEDRQFVEIARALSFGARFIILDGPTAQLDDAAISRLFERMRELGQQGVTFLFISHHLQEIYETGDTVTVYRDARHIVTAPVAELSRADLVTAMAGEARPGAAATGRNAMPAREPVLAVTGLSCAGGYAGVGLRVGAGEIVGLAGMGGSGKTEVAETLVGLRRPDTGMVTVAGRRPRPGDVPDALAAGIGFVPRDRHLQGLVGGMSVADNATLTIPRCLGPARFVSGARRDGTARTMIDNLAIKTPGPDLPVSDLSGGNQQKVVMARALANDPKLLVLITPTAGVDVRSREFLLGEVADSELVAPTPSSRQAHGAIAVAKLRDLTLIPAIVVICVIDRLVNPVFPRYGNLINVLQTMSEIALLVLAQTIVLVVGRMDLSPESTFGLAPGTAAHLTISGGQGLGLLSGGSAIPVTPAVGVVIGAVNAAGIRTERVLAGALIAASLLAALGGLLLSGRLASLAAAQGNGAIILIALVLSRITGGRKQE